MDSSSPATIVTEYPLAIQSFPVATQPSAFKSTLLNFGGRLRERRTKFRRALLESWTKFCKHESPVTLCWPKPQTGRGREPHSAYWRLDLLWRLEFGIWSFPMKGILLVNLGSPDSPSVPDVRRYLREFLMDGRVLDAPWPIRFGVVHFTILPKRPRESAHAYEKIWTTEGSPLVVTSHRVRKALER